MEDREKVAVLKEMVELRDSKLFKYLRERRDKAQRDLVTCANEIHVRWLQGRVQELDELFFEIDGARESLDKKPKPSIPSAKFF